MALWTPCFSRTNSFVAIPKCPSGTPSLISFLHCFTLYYNVPNMSMIIVIEDISWHEATMDLHVNLHFLSKIWFLIWLKLSSLFRVKRLNFDNFRVLPTRSDPVTLAFIKIAVNTILYRNPLNMRLKCPIASKYATFSIIVIEWIVTYFRNSNQQWCKMLSSVTNGIFELKIVFCWTFAIIYLIQTCFSDSYWVFFLFLPCSFRSSFSGSVRHLETLLVGRLNADQYNAP